MRMPSPFPPTRRLILYGLLLWATSTGHTNVHAYPTGAGAAACDPESPQVCHGGSPQTSLSPYTLVVQEISYSPGKNFNVTIKANATSPFKGFLLGAHRIVGNKTEYLGSFGATHDAQQQCIANGNSGATHTNASAKTNISLIWTPPSSDQGDIIFSCAVVKEYATYWVNISSGVLHPKGYTPSNDTVTTAPPPADETTASTSTMTFPKDTRCGKTSSCYGDCHGNECTFLATWYKTDQWLNITIKSIVTSGSNVWAALGFGTQAKMNPASVTECVAYNGQVKAFDSYNLNYGNAKVTPNATVGLSKVSGSLQDGVFTCTLLRQLVTGAGPQVFNLTSPFHILLARGDAQNWDILPHNGDNAFVTTDSYRVDANVDITASLKLPTMVKLHGCLMVIAWVCAASIGVLVARFNKLSWSVQKLCGVHVWFAIHRAVMVIAFLATVAGFAIIFIHVGDFSQLSGPEYKKIHPYLGIAVTALVVVNPIMSMFRCTPSHGYRPLFNWAHFLVGTAAFILGMITVGIGVTLLPSSEVSHYTRYIVMGFGGWHVLAHFILELIKWCERNDSMVGVYKDLQSFSKSYDASKYHQVRQSIFTTHVLVALAACIALCCIILGI